MKSFFSIIFIIQFFFSSAANALLIRLPQPLNLRKGGGGGSAEMAFIETLPKGTILEIPDENQIKNAKGEIDINGTINNWLRNSEMIDNSTVLPTGRYRDDKNRLKTASFFKVRVVKLPDDSDQFTRLRMEGQMGYMAIGMLARKGNLELLNNEDAGLLVTEEQRKAQEAAIRAQESIAETEAKVCENCDNSLSSNTEMIKKLREDLSPILNEVRAKTNRLINNKKIGNMHVNETIPRNFNKDCFGLNFNDFKNFVKEKSKQRKIPEEIMLGILSQESAGLCKAIGDKKSSTNASVGLFQINTGTAPDTSPFKNIDPTRLICNSSQLKDLQGKTIEQMQSGPRCLQNPALNLEAALDVFADKFKVVTGEDINIPSLKDASQTQRDLLRKTLSAYNGGQKWTARAEKEMKQAADKWGLTNIDLNKWEDLRLFLLRKHLEESRKLSKYGLSGGGRNRVASISNVSYVETIMGRDIEGFELESFATVWARENNK